MKLVRKSKVVVFLHIFNTKEMLKITECLTGALNGESGRVDILTNLVKGRGDNFFTRLYIEKGEFSALIIDQKPMTLILNEKDIRIMLAHLESIIDDNEYQGEYPEIVLKNKVVSLCMHYKK